MAKTSNAAATLLSGPTIVSAIVSLWNFVFVPHTNLFNSGENQLPSPRFEVFHKCAKMREAAPNFELPIWNSL